VRPLELAATVQAFEQALAAADLADDNPRRSGNTQREENTDVTERLIIDSHLDLGWNAMSWKRDITLEVDAINRAEAQLSDSPARGHATTSLPEMRRAGIAVCFATLLARSPTGRTARYEAGDLDFRTQDMAYGSARGQLAYYRALERRGELRAIATTSELDAHWAAWQDSADAARLPIGFVLAFEGSDGIVDPSSVAEWHAEGLRCASLVHYGANPYAVGTGEDGPLTARGRELLAAFERAGVILDVTHLSDTSFFAALDVFGGPVLASHNNCRALVPHQRQFSDEQLRRLLDRDAVIGIACDSWMLSPGYERGVTPRDCVSIDALADHIDRICELAGDAAHVAIGSDLDGGFGHEQTPVGLETIADLRKLEGILAARGYVARDIERVFSGNWLGFLRRHLPQTR